MTHLFWKLINTFSKSLDLTKKHLNLRTPKKLFRLYFVYLHHEKANHRLPATISPWKCLKWSFASLPCDTARHRFLTWACWTPIFHQTQNLTYFTEAEVRPDSSRLALLSFSVWLAVGLREIVVNLSRTWKVLYWVWRRCRPWLCFWCVNPVTLMPKHFSGCDTAQRVNAALNVKDWLAMFE